MWVERGQIIPCSFFVAEFLQTLPPFSSVYPGAAAAMKIPPPTAGSWKCESLLRKKMKRIIVT